MIDPPSIDPAIAGIAHATTRLAAQHHEETSALQKVMDRLTSFIGQPGIAVLLTLAIMLWVGGNLAAPLLGLRAADPPPFIWLQAVIGMLALNVAALILTTQRRRDQLASHREQLVLELGILNDQKASKIIALLEEFRRDSPGVFNRADEAAAAMATPSDPQEVLEAIKSAQDPAAPLAGAGV